MHLHELCGSWIDNPFWRSAIRLDSQDDLVLILRCGIQDAWIDISKGLDVAESDEIGVTACEPVALMLAPAPKLPPIVNHVSFEDELVEAAEICARGKQAITSMLQDVRMGRALNADNVQPLVEEISVSISRNPGALIGLARLKTKDDYTYMHSVAVCALMISLARQLGFCDEDTRQAGMAGLLHDVGKMAIPQHILNKPGALTDDEFVSVKLHPEAGHKILSEARGVHPIALDVCLHHHEKMNGTGYPHRLAGEQISLFARMGAVCDVYDAITSNRSYKAGWCPAESIHKMSEWKGHFDDSIFQAFVKSVGIYPVGTLVRMQSGRLGIVVEQTEKSLLKPQIKVFFSTKSMSHIAPELLSLSAPGLQDKIVSREDPSKWDFKKTNRFW